MTQFLNIVTVVSAALMAVLILLQARGATLGAGFGASGELFTTRRGLEKNLYEATLIVAVVFVLSLTVGLMIA
ncbi:MAG: preprotein translocase subunit SecG [Candidatus Nanoperiomorbaceae bacterium]